MNLTDSYFSPDTYANEHSALAARLAAGICADLATNIMSGRSDNGFALVSYFEHLRGGNFIFNIVFLCISGLQIHSNENF